MVYIVPRLLAFSYLLVLAIAFPIDLGGSSIPVIRRDPGYMPTTPSKRSPAQYDSRKSSTSKQTSASERQQQVSSTERDAYRYMTSSKATKDAHEVRDYEGRHRYAEHPSYAASHRGKYDDKKGHHYKSEEHHHYRRDNVQAPFQLPPSVYKRAPQDDILALLQRLPLSQLLALLQQISQILSSTVATATSTLSAASSSLDLKSISGQQFAYKVTPDAPHAQFSGQYIENSAPATAGQSLPPQAVAPVAHQVSSSSQSASSTTSSASSASGSAPIDAGRGSASSSPQASPVNQDTIEMLALGY